MTEKHILGRIARNYTFTFKISEFNITVCKLCKNQKKYLQKCGSCCSCLRMKFHFQILVKDFVDSIHLDTKIYKKLSNDIISHLLVNIRNVIALAQVAKGYLMKPRNQSLSQFNPRRKVHQLSLINVHRQFLNYRGHIISNTFYIRFLISRPFSLSLHYS